MPMFQHTMSTGETVDVHGTVELVEFLQEAYGWLQDPALPLDGFVRHLYSTNNPLLAEGPIPGHGWVTAEHLEHPAYAVMLDMINRKLIAAKLGASGDRGDFTVMVTEAAAELGISTRAVTMAAKEGRIAARKVGGRWMLSRAGVDGYRASGRGPGQLTPALVFRVGTKESVAVGLRTAPVRETFSSTGVLDGAVTDWHRAAVRVIDKNSGLYIVWILEPGTEPFYAHREDLFVEGRARVVEKIGNARKAAEAWDAFGRFSHNIVG